MNKPLAITARQVTALCKGAEKAGYRAIFETSNEEEEVVVSEPSSALFIVREIANHRLVGIFFIRDDAPTLAEAVDQLMDPGACEYAILSQLDLLFDDGPKFPLSEYPETRISPAAPPWFGGLTDANLVWRPVIEGWVYFLRVGERVKIGQAVNIAKRLKALQTGHPEKIELIYQYLGGPRHEQHYHERFKRQRERGEWFRFEGELKEFLESLE